MLIAHSTPPLYGERWPSFTNSLKLMSSKTTSIKLSKAIHKRLEFDQANVTIREKPEQQPETVENDPVPLAKELAYLLTQPPPTQNDSETFTKEVGLFTSGGCKTKTKALHDLSRSLLTIPPTSVEAERTFSASGLFLTKLRCRLPDTSLDNRYARILKFVFSVLRQNAKPKMSTAYSL